MRTSQNPSRLLATVLILQNRELKHILFLHKLPFHGYFANSNRKWGNKVNCANHVLQEEVLETPVIISLALQNVTCESNISKYYIIT